MKCDICNQEKNEFLENHGIMHVCPPAFDVRKGDGYSDRWDVIYTDDIGYSVDVYCDEHFSDWEYPSTGFTVEVKPHGTEGPITVYEIEVEAVPSFFVSEKAVFENQAALEASNG